MVTAKPTPPAISSPLGAITTTPRDSPGDSNTEFTVSGAGDHGNAIRDGAWETGLFCCLGTNFGAMLNAFMGWCLPCVTIAQVSHRLGVVNYWAVLFCILGIFAGERVLNHFYFKWGRLETAYLGFFAHYGINEAYTAATSEELHAENRYLQYTQIVIHLSGGMWAYIGVVPGIVMVVATWALRARTRARFSISGSCCCDGAAALFCPCCSVAQLATHLQIPKKCGCNVGPVDTLPAYT